MPERRPFDPSRIRPAPADAPAARGDEPLSVRQVNELIRGALARHLPPTLHVLGEIGDYSRPTSGHLYFALKDESSELRCVMWRSSAARLKFRPEPGLAVIATGAIEVYTPRGSVQLVVRKLEPRGAGALELAFRQLKERLEKEGLFDPRRKRPLPTIPQRIAIVTSPSGAAIRDILRTLERRFPILDILVYPVRVQGDGAAEEIATAIRNLNTWAASLGGLDVLLVGRGGGSLEDLWAFNEEIVARAIAASCVPVVSAVGHEVDVTISDLVADLRAATPTAAAELIAPTLPDLHAGLRQQTARLTRLVTHRFQLARAELAATLAYEGLARPWSWLGERSQWLDETQRRLHLATHELFRTTRARLQAAEFALLRYRSGARTAAAHHQLDLRTHRLREALHAHLNRHDRRLTRGLTRLVRSGPWTQLAQDREHLGGNARRAATRLRWLLVEQRKLLAARIQALEACDPRQVLRRGYSITRDAHSHRVLRSIVEIRDRLRIITELADGQFTATADDPRQPGLFE